MGFRADLDVSSYLENVGWGGERAPAVEPDLPVFPVLRGSGPVAWTTCTVIAVRYSIWDPNGYYRALGFVFPFHGITRAKLRLAALRKIAEAGIENEYYTYIFKFLKTKVCRDFYDNLPFCEPFIDPYISAWIKGEAAKVASARILAGELEVDQDSVLDEWGLVGTGGDDEVPSDSVSQKPEEEGPVNYIWSWKWAYYLWFSHGGAGTTDRLARWQELLVAVCAARGYRRQLAVGLMGEQPHDVLVKFVQGHTVVFLHEDVEPTQELALRAIVESRGITGEMTEEITNGCS